MTEPVVARVVEIEGRHKNHLTVFYFDTLICLTCRSIRNKEGQFGSLGRNRVEIFNLAASSLGLSGRRTYSREHLPSPKIVE